MAPPRTDLTEPLIELIRRAATDLPADIEQALKAAQAQEETGAPAERALATILENVALARVEGTPICQDTGVPTFYVRHPRAIDPRRISTQIEAAVAEATARSFLRPNAVDPISSENSGNNVGRAFPGVHAQTWDEERLEIDLLLKGGGSENVSTQVKLPHPPLEAERDLEGVRRVVLEAVQQAQGKGCPPGVLGIAIGGDRSTGYAKAKRQLLRPLDEVNPLPELAALEERLLADANRLQIGPMGFGGGTTLLGVRIGAYHRHPACYFVTMAYACWACRRASLSIAGQEVTVR